MKYTLKICNIILLPLIAVLFLTCTKEPQEIGMDLVSPDELLKLGYTDTTTIIAYTVEQDSMNTTGSSYGLAGSIYDPVFGKTSATWFGQLSLSTDHADFGENPVLDSAFMYVLISAVYGDTLSHATLNIHEVTQDFDSTNYTNQSLSYNNTPLGTLTFIPSAYDSIYYEGKMNGAILRIPVSYEFANRILTADTTKLYDSIFSDLVKGICITAPQEESTPGKGAIIRFIAVNKSYLKLYYHNDDDTAFYKLTVNENSLHFNHFNHFNYEHAAPALKNQLEGDTTLGGQYLFAQSMSGTKIKLRFPHLKSWFDNKKVVVNDAQLIITNTAPSGILSHPTALSLWKVQADGSQSSEYVVNIDDGGSNGGYYDKNSGTYRFAITRYIQGLMMGTERRYGLYITVPNESSTATRLAINGPQNSQSNLKLYIKYTVVE